MIALQLKDEVKGLEDKGDIDKPNIVKSTSMEREEGR